MKIRVQVCRGMMCSDYGGGRALEAAMDQELTALGVRDQVELITPNCMGSCSMGPCVRINGTKHYHINREDVPLLVRNEILPLLTEK